MSSLPPGWGDRNNQMSEKDMKLGGAAATKFASRSHTAYGNGDDAYKTSDQVREFYNKKREEEAAAASSVVPDGWEDRQKQRLTEAKQYGAFARNPPPGTAPKKTESSSSDFAGAEVALVQVATHSLEALAKTLENGPKVSLPMEERVAFANAVKRAMDALAKSG